MQDYGKMCGGSSSSLSEVQRIIGLSLSKIQLGRNQRGGLPLHKNLLVATVLNKARDLYMQETMYINYKMMTGHFASSSPIQSSSSSSSSSSGSPPEENHSEDYDEDSDVEDEEEEEEEAATEAVVVRRTSAVVKTSDEGFIDEPDCDCDARNFSSESSRVPFTYCYHCAPFHPSNGRGPTLVPSSSSSSSSTGSHHVKCQDTLTPSSSTTTTTTITPMDTGNLIYDMDSKSTEERPPCHGVRKRRLSDTCSPTSSSYSSETLHKRHRSASESDAVVPSDYSPESAAAAATTNEMFHPAFRSTGGSSSPPQSSCSPPSPTMEMDQITSLVSIFSFGQQIMAAAVAASEAETQKDNEESDKKEDSSDSESDTSSDSGHSSDDHENSHDPSSSCPLQQTIKGDGDGDSDTSLILGV